MKDYTKYDFAAIIGAEVSILLKSKVEYGGTLKIVSDKAIFLLMNDNPSALEGRWFAIEDIVPGSLSAKIKVEDMSMKQIEKCAIAQVVEAAEKAGYEVCDACCCNGFVYYNTRVMTMKVFFLDKEKERFKGHTNEYRCSCASISLDGFYSCTDWGWREL